MNTRTNKKSKLKSKIRNRVSYKTDYKEVKKSEISVDPEILSGTPVFSGTRVPIKILFDYLEGEEPLEEFLENYPTVSKSQALHIIHIAGELINSN